eukprot:CAMPEP_0179469254 /NCGR_PEP_ID=MMETSP0799-20121207/49995_1 /TAXON_ID=46947 /ORGANISM="Geminigera cryophila, Strain CCMP2564" /LENGTH=56 /DNA_ID=CAMNT_0021275703 /DNA_START=92 /DNA_END=259 /DNA_ORIENTATION=+
MAQGSSSHVTIMSPVSTSHVAMSHVAIMSPASMSHVTITHVACIIESYDNESCDNE